MENKAEKENILKKPLENIIIPCQPPFRRKGRTVGEEGEDLGGQVRTP